MGRLKTHIKDHESIVNEIFIETGTFEGESLEFAASLPFSEIHSCDVSLRHYQNAVEKFKDEPRIKLYLASSHTLLQTIIDPDKTTTFWLDGHWQNNTSDELCPEASECPLEAELRQIFSFNWKTRPVILIDDANHYPKTKDDKEFNKAGFRMEQWISIEEIESMAPSEYNFKIENDVIWIY
jgi:hypothetical protein